MHTTKIDEDDFEAMRDTDLQPEAVYEVLHEDGTTLYAWSPDGVGCYWYDSLEELLDQHG